MNDWRGDDPWRLRSDETGTYWLNTQTGDVERPKTSYVRGDTPEYISPITGKPVDGRRARREDLKRSGCVEMDPPARKRGVINPRFAARALPSRKARPGQPGYRRAPLKASRLRNLRAARPRF